MPYDDTDPNAGLPDLSAYDHEWQEAQPKPPLSDFNAVPDGTYQAVAEKMGVQSITRDSGEPRVWLSWQFRVVLGDHRDARLSKTSNWNTADQMAWLKTDLQIAGLTDLARLSDLPARCREIEGRAFQVRVKTWQKGAEGEPDKKNVNLVKRINLPPDVTAASPPPPPGPTESPSGTSPASTGAPTDPPPAATGDPWADQF